MKRKPLILVALILVLFVSVGYGDQSAKVCDECGSTQNVKTYWIKSPYGEIQFKNLCPNCVEVYRISVSMMNGTMGEASESDIALWESVSGGSQQSAPTWTPIPDTYTLAPGTTPSPELAKENQALYLRLLDQLEKESQPVEIIWPSHKSEGWDLVDLTGIPLENKTAETRTRSELMNNGMLLINSLHALPWDFNNAGLVNLTQYLGDEHVKTQDGNVYLFPLAADALYNVLDAAESDGVTNYFVKEGYFAQIDEYNSGLAFELGVYDESGQIASDYTTTAQARWMSNNCWKYGIVLRYPLNGWPLDSSKDKSHKTGITTKIGLYRYVGKGNAAVMHYLDYSIEEYVEYLQAHPHIALFKDDMLQYEIFRQEVGATDPIEVILTRNALSHYSSLDNTGGVITVFAY